MQLACLDHVCQRPGFIQKISQTQSKGQAIYHADAPSGCGFKKWILIGVIQREGKKGLAKGINLTNPCNRQSGLP